MIRWCKGTKDFSDKHKKVEKLARKKYNVGNANGNTANLPGLDGRGQASLCMEVAFSFSSVGREKRRAEPSAVALGAALIGSQHEKCLYSQQSDSVTNLFAWLVQEIRLNGNPPERRPAFEGPAAFLTGEW